MSELSNESKLELLAEVVRNHSNEINEFKKTISNDWAPWTAETVRRVTALQERVEGHGKLILDLNDRVEKLEMPDDGGHFWGKFLLVSAIGIAGYLGYKAIENHGERLEKIEKRERSSEMSNIDKAFKESLNALDAMQEDLKKKAEEAKNEAEK